MATIKLQEHLESNAPASRRRLWQIACRAGLILLLALLGAYATLPWYLPTGLLRESLQGRLSEQMGAQVTMQNLSVNWGEGLRIEGLKIASKSGPVAEAASVRADFSPLTLLLCRRLDWLEIDQPQLSVRVEANGSTNLSSLAQNNSSDLAITRTSVHEAIVSLQLPNDPRTLRLHVSDLQLLSGQLQRIGRLTLSAALEQNESLAPLSMRMWAESGRQRPAGGAFNFTNVQLEQLMLPRLLGLPLSKLAGACSGSLELKMNDRGVVDRFDVDVHVKQLDVQSTQGPRLPVFEEAGVSLTAVCDPFPGQPDVQKIDIQSLKVRLPGMDLSGRASLLMDLPEAQLEQISLIELSGTTDPSQVATLLTGKAELPGQVTIDGPLNLRFLARRQASSLALELGLDATGAVLRSGDAILKPLDRTLQWEMTGTVDARGWRFAAEKSTLLLGDNEFSGRGSIHEIVDLVDRYSRPSAKVSARELLRDISRLEWKGGWEIRDLASLGQAIPPLADAIKGIRVKTPIRGQFALSHKDGSRFLLAMTVPAQGQFELRGFKQLADTPLTLQFSASFPEDAAGVRDVELELAMGAAGVRVDRGYVNFAEGIAGAGVAATMSAGATTMSSSGPAEEQPTEVEIGGDVSVDQVQTLLACLGRPMPEDVKVEGNIRGQGSAKFVGTKAKAKLATDLSQLELAWPGRFGKPAQQAAAVEVEYAADAAAKDAEKNTAILKAQLPYADVLAKAGWSEWTAQAMCRGEAQVEVKDAAALLAAVRPLRASLGSSPVEGACRMSASGEWQQATGLALAVDADGDALRVGDKDAHTPLGLHVSATVQPRDGKTQVELTAAHVRAAQSRVDLSGKAVLAGSDWLAPSVETLEARLSAKCTVEDALCRVLPQAQRAVAECGLAGTASVEAALSMTPKEYAVEARLDAGELAVRSWGTMAKPRGVAASAELKASMQADRTAAKVKKFRVVLGEAGAMCEASLVNAAGAGGAWRPRVTTGHVSAWSRNSVGLAKVLPGLAENALHGDASLDVDFDNEKGQVGLLELHAQDFGGRVRGRAVAVSGNVRVNSLQLRRDALPEIQSVNVDGLDFQIGQNKGTLVVDLSRMPERTVGSVQVLASFLDDQDLAGFFAPSGPASQPVSLSAATSQPAGGEALSEVLGSESLLAAAIFPPSAPASLASKPVEQRAEEIIKEMRRVLGGCNFTISASVDRYKTFDPKVGQTYDARFLQLDGGVNRGQILLGYNVGVNGGVDRVKIQTNLNDLTPMVNSETALLDVKATAEIRPQIEAYFPGNIVEGNFSRTEQMAMPLRDVVANRIDSRYPLRPVGSARTVTTDGYVEGQGAPKFVTRVFPGLNLTRYNYTTMTGFADFKADGSADNDMIFSGKYDVYIEGRTGPDHWGEYDIGVILTTGSPEWNHSWKQGRVPILKFRGRIEGGKILDQTVTYFWPNETLFKVFLENNVLYRLWLNRQILGG